MFSRFLVVAQVLALLLAATPASAQSGWPSKPIRLILQSPPGGSMDLIARLIQAPVQDALGQPIVIESRTGSLGIPAGIAAAQSRPDGYTFAVFGTQLASNPTIAKSLPYDTLRDFSFVALIAKVPNMIAVHPSEPINTIGDLIAAAKAKPGALSFASPGKGSTAHLTGELLKLRGGVDILHVPYAGAGPAVLAALSGVVPIVITTAGGLQQHVQSGKLRALAVSGSERLPVFPNLPTVQEEGFRDFNLGEWFVMIGPAGLPPDVVRRMNAEVNRATAMPAIADRLRGQGFQIGALSPEELRSFIESEMKSFRTLIEGAKISFE
jgi:tripartite-type tricarboxylate transporter receptor subunit TctC